MASKLILATLIVSYREYRLAGDVRNDALYVLCGERQSDGLLTASALTQFLGP